MKTQDIIIAEEKIKGVDGKACWPGKRYAGKVKKADGTYKDKCVPVKGVAEAAPPGAKAERMVKHIKAGYAKDGKLTDVEKRKAFGAAWKAHNKGVAEAMRPVPVDKPRFDPLVAKIAAKMQGPTWNDAETALITVLGTSAYNERPGFYGLWLRQAIDKYSKESVAEGINSIMDIVSPALRDNRPLDGYINSLYSYIEKNKMENDPKWKQAEKMASDYHYKWFTKNGYPTANSNPELAREGEKLEHRALIQAVAQLFGQQGVVEGYDPVESDYRQWEDILVKDGYRGEPSGAYALELVVGHQLMSDPAEVASTIRNILTYVKQNRQVLGKAVSDRTTVKDAIIDIKNKFPQQYQAAQQPQGVAEGFNGEYDDEAGMADNNLETLRRAVDGLDNLIDSGDNLPEWCQEKIAVAKSMLVNVWDYMASEEDSDEVDPEVDEMFEAMDQLAEQLAAKHRVSADTVWESFEALDDRMLYETAAWRRKEGKSKSGGLNAKGVASYCRENPGSKLQTAVTTKPSKLKPGSKAAKRRKSFCARMSGVKGPMKKPNGKPTRKALALRKWNC